MDPESLYTATKWDILKLLETAPYSPIELAEKLGGSLANVSQQLRLLELAGLITSDRIPNRDKGQPRVRYRLAGDLGYVIATSGNFVDKKLLRLTDLNKATLRIWFLDDPVVRIAIEKTLWQIADELPRVTALAYAGQERGTTILEYSGVAKLPPSVSVGQPALKVLLRKVAKPHGATLLQR